MATVVQTHSLLSIPETSSRPAPAVRAASPARPSVKERPYHRGDWIGLLIWAACFVLLASMLLFEAVVKLLR